MMKSLLLFIVLLYMIPGGKNENKLITWAAEPNIFCYHLLAASDANRVLKSSSYKLVKKVFASAACSGAECSAYVPVEGTATAYITVESYHKKDCVGHKQKVVVVKRKQGGKPKTTPLYRYKILLGHLTTTNKGQAKRWSNPIKLCNIIPDGKQNTCKEKGLKKLYQLKRLLPPDHMISFTTDEGFYYFQELHGWVAPRKGVCGANIPLYRFSAFHDHTVKTDRRPPPGYKLDGEMGWCW